MRERVTDLNLELTTQAVLSDPDRLRVIGQERAELEPIEIMRRRNDEASNNLPLDQLALSPQCGFGGLDHVVIPEDDMWRKFERILEVARLTWD